MPKGIAAADFRGPVKRLAVAAPACRARQKPARAARFGGTSAGDEKKDGGY